MYPGGWGGGGVEFNLTLRDLYFSHRSLYTLEHPLFWKMECDRYQYYGSTIHRKRNASCHQQYCHPDGKNEKETRTHTHTIEMR